MDVISIANKNEITSPTNSTTNVNTDKTELSRNDLLKLLSCLEGKLEASEIAIAALKLDRLKRLFYPTVIKRTNRTKKLNRNSLNYATIIPTNKILKNDKEDNKLNEETNLDFDLNISTDKSNTNETNLDDFIDDFNKELEDDIKNDGLFPNDRYNEYRKTIENNPYLALAGDLKYAYDTESNETLITKVYNCRVLRVKQLIQQQQDARKFLEEQLDELSTRYKNVVDELEIEKDKNIRFKRDEIVKKLEKTEQEKKELEDELNNLKKEFEGEKEREKVMVIYLLSERKELIIRLIEESGKNTELLNLLSSEKNRSAEIEEGLEEESKRSLQMEIELECLTNKYETEKVQFEEKVKNLEKRNLELEQKLNDLINSNSNNNNNSITTNKNLPDLGEGVRSTIVTFNNAIANLAGSTVVSSSQQTRPNVVQSLQTKPSLAAKPSFDSLNNVNGKVTIMNTTSSQPCRTIKTDQPNKSKLNNNQQSQNLTNSITNEANSTTSVASVIQKFSNTISNNTNQHQPIIKKLSSGLVANIAQSIVGNQQLNQTAKSRPPVPQKPAIRTDTINSQLLKERSTTKLMEQTSNDNEFFNLNNEIDLIKQINTNLEELAKTSLTEACSKNAPNFEKISLDKSKSSSNKSEDSSEINLDRIEDGSTDTSNVLNDLSVDVSNDNSKDEIEYRPENISEISEIDKQKTTNRKKFVRADALKSQNSK